MAGELLEASKILKLKVSTCNFFPNKIFVQVTELKSDLDRYMEQFGDGSLSST